MATATLRPNAAGYLSEWSPFPFMSTNYQNVDEVSSDGDSTYNYNSAGADNRRDAYNLESWSPGAVTISSVTIHLVAKRSGTIYTVKPFLRLNSTNNDGSAVGPATSYTEYDEQISRPGGGSWSVDDINNLEVGIYCPDDGTPGKIDNIRVTQVWIVVDYSVGTFPAPTSLLCDRETSPTNASEDPIFSAIFNGDSPSDTATHAYIQVSEKSDFSTTVWDSGWIDITDVDDGDRCDNISYSGSTLSTDPENGQYYWKIKFKDASKETAWSAYATFKGINREWADTGFASRFKLLLDVDHPSIGTDYTFKVDLQTGFRKAIADNGCFNEAIQASGGFQVQYYGGRWHIVYLSAIEDDANAQYAIYVVSYDSVTDVWGTSYKIANSGTSSDTHYFPTLLIPQSGSYAGYIHVFYGCHGGIIKYARSKQANKSGSLPGDPDPAWDTGMSIGSGCTYPIGLHVESADRMFVFARDGLARKYTFWYSDNNGSSWSSAQSYIENVGASKKRVYQYGFRFDRHLERLHVAFSYTDNVPGETSMGVWYAYSDYDSGETEGFHIWKEADGTTCGTTGSDLINRTDLTATVETSENEQFFASGIILTKSGAALVVIEHHHRDDSAQDPNAIIVARYSSGWSLAHLSDQTGYQNRVGRCGTPSLTDRDGTLHLFTCESGRAPKHAIPDANGNHTAWSQSPGTGSLYDKVDDGVHQVDADTTYIYSSSGSQKATFTSTYEIPENCTVLKVEVEILARIESSSASIRPILRISSTDYNGDSESVTSTTRYKRFVHTWDLNPNTSAAWTESGAENCEFGVEFISGGVCRVTRVTKRLLCKTALDQEFWSGEIIEFLSSDDGVNWSGRELTENTGIGVPILNSTHQLQNEQVALVWTSGHQVFFFTDEPFGRILRSGRGVAVYYAGLEIDRVLDYPNALVTTIRFKCQAVIAAQKIAGADDYYIYTGNAAGATRATKADPDNIFLKFDNFEALVGGSNLNGQRNWTVNSGTITVFDTGGYLNHTNKTYGGGQSVQIATSGEAEKIIGTDVLNVHVLIGLWMEGSAGYLGFRLVDGSSNIWEAGLDHSNAKPYYGTGSTSSPSRTTIDSPRIRRATYNRFEIQVTASGCSAWVNGVQFADEISALTDVDDLQVLSTAANSFFDFLWVMLRFERRITTTISQGSVSDYTMVYNMAHTSIYAEAHDAKHDAETQYSIYKIEVKIRAKLNTSEIGKTATFDIHLATGATYSVSTWVDNEDNQIINLIDDTWVEKTITFDSLDADQYSVKIDFYATTAADPNDVDAELYQVKYFYWVRDPVWNLQSEERRGFYLGATILGGGRDQFTMGANVSGFHIEHGESLRAEFGSGLDVGEPLPIGYLGTLLHGFQLNTESRSGLVTTESLPVDYLGTISQAFRLTLESLQKLTRSEVLPISSQGTIQISEELPIEIRQGVEISGKVPVESLVGFAIRRRLPVESRGCLEVSKCLPIESLSASIVQEQLLVEFGNYLAIVQALPVEFGLQITDHVPLRVEFLGTLFARESLPIEIRSGFAAGQRLPIETRMMLRASERFPVEWRRQVRWLDILSVEYGGGVQFRRRLPTESRGSLREAAKLPVEYLQAFDFANLVLVESGIVAAASFRIPMAWLQGFRVTRPLPVEFKGTVVLNVTGRLPVEWREGFAAPFPLPIEYRTGFKSSDQIPVEFGGTIRILRRLPIEYRSTLEVIDRLPIDFLRVFSTSDILPIEASQLFRRSNRIPAAWLHTFQRSDQVPVEFLGTVVLNVTKTLPVEFRQGFTSSDQLPVENREGFTASDILNVVWLQGFTRREDLPIEFRSTPRFGLQIPIEYLQRFGLSDLVLVEYNQGFTAHRKIPTVWRQGFRMADRLPVEWLGTVVVTVIKALPVEFRQGLEVGDRLLVESGEKFTSVDRLPLAYLQGLRRSDLIPVEFLGTIIFSASRKLPVEYREGFQTSNQIPIEYRKGFERSDALMVAWLTSFTAADILPIEFRSTPEFTIALPVEYLQAFGAGNRVPLEAGQSASASKQIPVEARQGFTAGDRIPIEWQGTVAFSVTKQLPVEFRGTLRMAEPIPAEYLSRVRISDGQIPIEFLGCFSQSDRLIVDWVQTSRWFQRFYVAFLERVSFKSRGLVEWLEMRTASWGLPVEFRQAISVTRRLPVEWAGEVAFSVAQALPVEWRATISESGRLAIDYLGKGVFDAALPLEYGQGIGVSGELPIESRATISDLIARLTIEWVETISARARFPIESGTVSRDSVRLVIENLERRVVSGELPVEWLGSEVFSAGFRLPVSWISTFAQRLQLPVEYRSTIEIVGNCLLVDWGTKLTVRHPLLIEFGQGFAVAHKLLAEWFGTIGVRGRFSVEFRGAVLDSIRLNVEYGEGFVTETRLPVQWLKTLLVREGLPVEWWGVAITALCIANATIKTPGLAGATISTAELRAAILTAAGLMGPTVTTGSLATAELKIAKLFNQMMKGGDRCRSSS